MKNGRDWTLRSEHLQHLYHQQIHSSCITVITGARGPLMREKRKLRKKKTAWWENQFLQEPTIRETDLLLPILQPPDRTQQWGLSLFSEIRSSRKRTLPDQLRHHKYCHRVPLTQTIETSGKTRGFTQRGGGSLNVALLCSGGEKQPNRKARTEWVAEDGGVGMGRAANQIGAEEKCTAPW